MTYIQQTVRLWELDYEPLMCIGLELRNGVRIIHISLWDH